MYILKLRIYFHTGHNNVCGGNGVGEITCDSVQIIQICICACTKLQKTIL